MQLSNCREQDIIAFPYFASNYSSRIGYFNRWHDTYTSIDPLSLFEDTVTKNDTLHIFSFTYF
jgi:hypothetical protein